MSCFVVEDKLISDIMNFVRLREDKTNIKNSFITYKFSNQFDFQNKQYLTSDILNLLALKLVNHNIESWNVRYPDHAMKIESQVELKSCYKSISIGQFLKNLDCLEYQSCEVENYYSNLHSSFWDIQKLRSYAIGLIDGYEQASWG